ncbi:MAG: cysteine--tRNA ligase [Oligoflexia bacterium]|nr:cysteine--tRNA ligase [Oligoflexia bacterium]
MTHQSLQLYNTLNRKIEPFTPLNPNSNVIKMYTCGPTVYNFAHIGNLRTYINEDTLRRCLEFNQFQVQHVMNITDVGHLTSDEDSGDDKMELGAQREGLSIWEMAQKFTDAFVNDITELHILPPKIWCKATEHINEQIELIKKLEAKGLTYPIEDGIYYDTSKFPTYGKLGGQSLDELKGGARIGVTHGKRNITDFALWKFSPSNKKRLMEWDSPWGKGFPGWHIECSAMALKYLGDEIDIHCGGIDHVKVHHTNEIAQVEPITGKSWVRFWFHPEFLIEKDKEGTEEKMSKSKGEFLTLSLLKNKGYHPLDYRYYALNSHYRSKLNFSYAALDGAKQGRHNLIKLITELPLTELGQQPTEKSTLLNIINKDLNTPELLAYLWSTLKNLRLSPSQKCAMLPDIDALTGLNLIESAKEFAEQKLSLEQNIPAEILQLAEDRLLAKKNREFQKADQLREEVKTKGYKIIDEKDKYKIEKL